MKWNYISMIFYFCASAFLIAFAFTSSNIWLGCGVISLALAVIIGRASRNKEIKRTA